MKRNSVQEKRDVVEKFMGADLRVLQQIEVYSVDTLIAIMHDYLGTLLEYGDIDTIGEQIRCDIDFFRENDQASQDFSDDDIHSGRQSVIAVTRHRIIAGLLQTHPDLAATLTRYNRHIYSITGMEIGPKANIGVPFATDHHTLVIGETSTVGDFSFMYHGCTLGATDRDSEVMGRHPHVGDHVWMGLDVSILGQSIIKGGTPKEGRKYNTNIAANVTIINSILEPYVSVGVGVSIENAHVPANHHVVRALPGGEYVLVDKETRKESIQKLPQPSLQELEQAFAEWSQ